MTYVIINELLFVILCLVQSDYSGYSKMFKNLYVILGGVAHSFISLKVFRWLIHWPHQRHKLLGNDPIEIAIFKLFIVLVLSVIEILKAVPAQFHGIFKSLQALVDRTRVIAFSITRVPVRYYDAAVRLKDIGDFLCFHFQYNKHKGAHKKSRIGLLIVFRGAIMVQLLLFELGVNQKTHQFSNVFVNLSDG
jgi:hypothetical protein